MQYSLFYFEDVKTDVREAKAWYKRQKDGLEKRFTEAIKTGILAIQENPFAYALRYKNIRIAHLKTFPYGIHFYIDVERNQITIISIAHHKRNPNVSNESI